MATLDDSFLFSVQIRRNENHLSAFKMRNRDGLIGLKCLLIKKIAIKNSILVKMF